MQRSAKCKFYAQGRCLKGDFCQFSHHSNTASPKKACIYYQKGTCTNGDRCRFEHSKPSWMSSSASSSSAAPAPISVSSGDSAINSTENTSIENLSTVKPDIPCEPCAENGGNERMDLCSTCGKYCLDPSNPEDRQKHVTECEKNQQALENSKQVECSVCLDVVLSKISASERQFGLLSECDHVFCIDCIKKWRRYDVNNDAARACPMCRKVSYYVIPSPIWFSSNEEKQEIINKYKAKLKSIDCRYFNFGNGHCRHGTNCFYKHEVKAGPSGSNRSSKSKNKRKNRQTRVTWDDDHLGFGEFVDLSLLDAMLVEFEQLFFVDEGIGGDEDSEAFAEMYRKLSQLGLSNSESDYDYDCDDFDPDFEYDPRGGAINLEPWQRRIFYEQTGYYDFDDFTNCYESYDD